MQRQRLRVRRFALALPIASTLAAPLVSSTGTQESSGAATLAIVGGRLVDGYGGLPAENVVVLIKGDTIAAVGLQGSVDVPAGATVIDADGMTVLPGLWESHGHLMHLAEGTPVDFERRFQARMPEIMAAAARATLDAGVTSFRDLGGPLEPILGVKAAVAAGTTPGPHLYISGPTITYRETGPQTSPFTVATPEEAGAAVEQLLARQVDQISLTGAWDEAVLERIVSLAHRAGKGVDSGPRHVEAYRMAVRAGVDRLHTVFVTDALSDYTDDDLRLLVRGEKPVASGPSANILRGPFILPAMEVRQAYVRALAFPETVDSARWRTGLPTDLAGYLHESWKQPASIPWGVGARDRMPAVHDKLRRFVAAGGREQLVAGTDAGSPLNFHSPIPREILDLAEAGLTPMEAIQSATLRAAQLQGVEARVGTVSVGKVADIVIVDGDPLQDLRLLQHSVVHVIKDGRVHR